MTKYSFCDINYIKTKKKLDVADVWINISGIIKATHKKDYRKLILFILR